MSSPFLTFYKEVIEVKLKDLEKQRKKVKIFSNLAIFIYILLFGYIKFVGNLKHKLSLKLVLVGFIFYIAFSICLYNIEKKYKRKFKKEIVSRIIKFINPSFIYDFNNHIPETEFRKSGIFNSKIDNFTGADFVSGKIDNIRFSFSELRVDAPYTLYDAITKKSDREKIIFKGLFFKADFNKKFSGKTVIVTDTSEKTFGRLANTFQSIFSTKGELVKLEDPEFEKEYAVFSDSQQQARYILSPAFVKRIMDFKTKTGLRTEFSFVDSYIYLAIHMSWDSDFIEPPTFSKIDFNTVSACYRNIIFVLDIIKELDLNTRIWSKE